MPEIKPGATLAVLGFTFTDEKGDAVLRAEYVWLDGQAYGLRSSPAFPPPEQALRLGQTSKPCRATQS